jgi:outer membrane protein assembly factor BamB/tetratricopeptide (TPR) repeat protein
MVLLGLAGLSIGLGGGVDADQNPLTGTTFPKESQPTLVRLVTADKLAAGNRWAEALDDYRRILEDSGRVLVAVDARNNVLADPADKTPSRFVQARRLIQLRLARPNLPKEALRLYRRRHDDQARSWLKEGAARRDGGILRRIVDDAFRSSVTDAALELLGDLACERGCFAEAQHWWRMIAAPVGQDAQVKPDSSSPCELCLHDAEPDRTVRVRAKLIIARLFQGDWYKLADDVRCFEKQHPNSVGYLAGVTGNYAAILKNLVAKITAQPPIQNDDIWTTFAGDPARNLIIPTPLSARIAAEGCKWSARLDSGAVQGSDGPVTSPSAREKAGSAAALAFHPVIAGQLVLWADARFVNAHDLLSGRRVFRYDLVKDGGADVTLFRAAKLTLPPPPGLRYTLSVVNDRAFVRLGAQDLSPPTEEKPAVPRNTFIVCLDLKPNAVRREIWKVAGKVRATDKLDFEGAPLVHAGHVYAVLSQVEASATKSWIGCFAADSGRELWRQAVCETRTPRLASGDARRLRHDLLTRAGPNIIYCSHSGAIVAVDAADGQPAWAYRYPSRGPLTEDGKPSPRDLAPCVAAAGLVYAAPHDSDRLLCLNAATGRLVWDLDRVEVVHLLGVAEGRLIFTTPDGIRAVEAATGDERNGWAQPGEGSKGLPTFGRGFLAGGWVFWPVWCRSADVNLPLRALNALDGQQHRGEDAYDPTQFYRLQNGNLTCGNGCLVVAGTERLFVYVPEERYLPERKAAAARPQAGPLDYYRLALAEADAGLLAEALNDFARAERAEPGVKFRGTWLRGLAREGRHRCLLEMAWGKAAAKRWAEAAALLNRAAAAEFSAAARAQALCRLAETWSHAGQPAQAVATWQLILADPVLHYAPVTNNAEPARSARSLAIARVKESVQQFGLEVYAPFEQQATALLASIRDGNEVEILSRLAREYPNAAVTGPALLRLARVHDRTGQPAAAVRSYRMLLRHGRAPPLTEDDLASARLGLAQAYERQHRWPAARRAWQDLASYAGDRLVLTQAGKQSASAVAAEELRKPVYRTRPATSPHEIRLPLLRAWERPPPLTQRGESVGRLLVPQTELATESAPEVALFARGAAPSLVLDGRDVTSGKRLWQLPLAHAPIWTGRLDDMAFLAGPEGIICLSVSQGNPLWELRSPPLPAITHDNPSHTRLSAFHLNHAHLYCLQDECRLLALEVDTGRVAWSHWAPAAALRPLFPDGRFLPWLNAGDEWLVVQAGTGRQLVLDSDTGRLLHSRECGGELRCRPPLALGERKLCLVTDPARVVMHDPATGKDLWTYDSAPSSGSTLSSGEPPRLFGQGEVLVALLARNFGYQLERLDPQTGAPLWTKGARITREAPGRLAFDDAALYYVSRRILVARALTTGRVLWSRALSGPSGEWNITVSNGFVLAIATPALKGKGLRLTICAASDGALVEVVDFPGVKPEGGVQVFRHGLVVAVDGQAWGLASAARKER